MLFKCITVNKTSLCRARPLDVPLIGSCVPEPAAQRRVGSPRPTVGHMLLHSNDSAGRNPVIKKRVLTDNYNKNKKNFRFYPSTRPMHVSARHNRDKERFDAEQFAGFSWAIGSNTAEISTSGETMAAVITHKRETSKGVFPYRLTSAPYRYAASLHACAAAFSYSMDYFLLPIGFGKRSAAGIKKAFQVLSFDKFLWYNHFCFAEAAIRQILKASMRELWTRKSPQTHARKNRKGGGRYDFR